MWRTGDTVEIVWSDTHPRSYLEVHYQSLWISKPKLVDFSYFSAWLRELQSREVGRSPGAGRKWLRAVPITWESNPLIFQRALTCCSSWKQREGDQVEKLFLDFILSGRTCEGWILMSVGKIRSFWMKGIFKFFFLTSFKRKDLWGKSWFQLVTLDNFFLEWGVEKILYLADPF